MHGVVFAIFVEALRQRRAGSQIVVLRAFGEFDSIPTRSCPGWKSYSLGLIAQDTLTVTESVSSPCATGAGAAMPADILR